MLEIKSLDEHHNHETSKELFRNLPQQRKLDEAEKENIRQMLDMKANKKNYSVERDASNGQGRIDERHTQLKANKQQPERPHDVAESCK